MSTVRRIKKILKSKPTLEGAGVHLKNINVERFSNTVDYCS
jgi:hypothetical protein